MDPEQIPSFKATNEFDQMMDALQSDPDLVHEVARDGKPVAVIISPVLYERLQFADGGHAPLVEREDA